MAIGYVSWISPNKKYIAIMHLHSVSSVPNGCESAFKLLHNAMARGALEKTKMAYLSIVSHLMFIISVTLYISF